MVFYSVLWVANYHRLRTTGLDDLTKNTPRLPTQKLSVPFKANVFIRYACYR